MQPPPRASPSRCRSVRDAVSLLPAAAVERRHTTPPSPLASAPLSLPPCHHDAAAPREPLAITPSSSRHSARARHHRRSPTTVDSHLWCSSGPIHPTRCSPTSPTGPTTADRPPHQRTPPLDRHCHREPATVSLLPPFAPNQGHHRPRSLPGQFLADQRRPTGQIRSVSRRRRGGGVISLPCFPGWAETPEGAGPLSRAGRSPAVG
jgi:hypothetical protein